MALGIADVVFAAQGSEGNTQLLGIVAVLVVDVVELVLVGIGELVVGW